MSFQGDVAGIGLGELLQGLARGGRDGVLTLQGHRLAATLGWLDGQVYMLPHPDEEQELWQRRAEMAFLDEQDPELAALRQKQIARAQRIENFYSMLDAPNLHFRFEPGPLPMDPLQPAGEPVALDAEELPPAATPEELFGPGWTVEYLLLEHARVSDEIKTGPGATIRESDIPQAPAPEDHPGELRNFLECCEGSSTVQEIADRLGWPLSECRAVLGEQLAVGNVRLFEARELFASAQSEMAGNHTGRAAVRLRGWIKRLPVGPISGEDADMLIEAWRKSQLGPILHVIDASSGRRMLRKLEPFERFADELQGLWQAMREAHPQDSVTGLHALALRMSGTSTPDGRAFKDLLRIARNFQDAGRPARARTLLRLAASHLPERPQTRVEIGRRMLEADLVDEGVRWLLDTATELIASDPEGAMFPLRAILRDLPDHGEARALMQKARDRITRRKRQRWSALVGLSIGLVLSLFAFVRYRSYRQVEYWIREAEALAEPVTVLRLLEEEFGPHPPQRIAELRSLFAQRKRGLESAALKEWTALYHEAEEACRFGDPLEGLRRTLALPAPPNIPVPSTGWPETSTLYGLLGASLEQRSVEVDVSAQDGLEELKPEEHLIDLMSEILEHLPPAETPDEAQPFRFRVAQLLGEVRERRGERSLLREERLTEEKEEQQDILLATARAHERAGDLESSLLAYERLLDSEEDLATLPELTREIARVRAHWNAVRKAERYADGGRHAEAAQVLREVCPRPSEHLLAFQVDSLPRGARVELPNGRERRTPFVTKAGVGERVELRFDHEGFQERTLTLEDPRDLLVHLYRFPERTWASPHRIEAVPVRAGLDHIVCDRFGRVQRIDETGAPLWELELETLGGIARTPVFLPGRPGWLLFVSEDGLAWLIEAEDGDHEGPLRLNALPADGPTLGPNGVRVLFEDSRIGIWSDDLEPVQVQSPEPLKRLPESEASRSHVLYAHQLLHRPSVLKSPWTSWSVTVRENEYRIVNEQNLGFSAERAGSWTFVAWDPPTTTAPQGRLWVADEKGLRSYVPDMERLVELTGKD